MAKQSLKITAGNFVKKFYNLVDRLPVYAFHYNRLKDDYDLLEPTAGEISADTISERTSGSGVTIDGVLMKDGNVLASDGMLASAPLINGTKPTDTIVFFEDFIDTASTKAAGNGKFAVAADNTAWFVTEVDSATGQTETVLGVPADNGLGGWGTFTTCNADNDS